jgi:biotin operon repressor
MKAPVWAVLRRLSDGGVHSGERLAEELGCSRASVNARIQALADGYQLRIDRVRGQGYRLLSPIDWLDAAAIQAGAPAGVRVEVVEETASTNSDMLARAAAGEASGLARLAESQTAGRGRFGRRWLAPLGGGLTFSLLWRFECGVGQLSGQRQGCAGADSQGGCGVTPEAIQRGIVGGDGPLQRRAMAKAITLLESTRADHRAQGDALLTEIRDLLKEKR